MNSKKKEINLKESLSDSDLIIDFNSPKADAILRLQANIDAAKVTCFALTSANNNEGRTPLAINLALLYAKKGFKSCLVDLDLRESPIPAYFGLEGKLGVSDYVSKEDVAVEDLIQKAKGVDLLLSGSKVDFPPEILSSKKLANLIEELKKKYDYVIVNTPSLFNVSDAFIIAPLVDGFLLTCVQHVAKKNAVKAACVALEEKNIKILGIVMNKVTSNDDSANYSYGYEYWQKFKKHFLKR